MLLLPRGVSSPAGRESLHQAMLLVQMTLLLIWVQTPKTIALLFSHKVNVGPRCWVKQVKKPQRNLSIHLWSKLIVDSCRRGPIYHLADWHDFRSNHSHPSLNHSRCSPLAWGCLSSRARTENDCGPARNEQPKSFQCPCAIGGSACVES